MKIKPLLIQFESLEDFAARTKKKLKNTLKPGAKPKVQKKNVLLWQSVETYQRFMSDQKYAILATIHKHKPESVYQLAKLLNRAQPNVARDCDSLAGHGFIDLIESGSSRGGLIPSLVFDYNAVIVELPSVSYKIEFGEDAA